MPRKAALRAVRPGDAADPEAPRSPLSVAEAAKTGTHRDLLVAMRERIAQAVSDPQCPPRDLAALTRRLQDIAKEIEALDLRAKEEGVDASSAPDEAWDSSAL